MRVSSPSGEIFRWCFAVTVRVVNSSPPSALLHRQCRVNETSALLGVLSVVLCYTVNVRVIETLPHAQVFLVGREIPTMRG